MEKILLMTAKMYSNIFGVDIKTARSWYKEDLVLIGRKRLTLDQFQIIYKNTSPLAPVVQIEAKRKAARVGGEKPKKSKIRA